MQIRFNCNQEHLQASVHYLRATSERISRHKVVEGARIGFFACGIAFGVKTFSQFKIAGENKTDSKKIAKAITYDLFPELKGGDYAGI